LHSRLPALDLRKLARRLELQRLSSRCGLMSMIVIETLVVVGKPYDSSEHPAASVLLNEILGSNDCAGLNGAERRLLEAVLIHKHRAGLVPV
jgi:hypothetical protein